MPVVHLGRRARVGIAQLVLVALAWVTPARAQLQQWNGTAFVRVPGKGLTADDMNAGKAYAIQQGAAQAVGQLGTAVVPTTVEKTVFIGSVQAGYLSMVDPVAHAQLLADGRIGLYQHGNGNALMTPAQRNALWATWGGTGVTATGQGTTLGEVGPFAPVPASYLAYFGGRYPNEVNINVYYTLGATYTATTGDARPGTVYGGYATPGDLAAAKGQVDAAIAAGARNVAAYVGPNAGLEDLDDAFATAPFWAPVRALALYGGGLALDVPPSYWVDRGPAYQGFVAQMLQWAVANRLRANVTVSNYARQADGAGHTGGDGYDPAFLQNLQLLVTTLAAQNALPSQWVVENYGNPGTTGNDIQADGSRNDLTAAALYLARAVRTAPSGTAPAGANGVADAGLMVSAVNAPAVRAALPATIRVGRMRLADIDGLGTLASDDRDNVYIVGGAINGPVTIVTSRAVSAAAGFDGGSGRAALFNSGLLLVGGSTSAQLTAIGGIVRIDPTAGAGGLKLPPVPVASLPASCLPGTEMWASNARNAGEAAGAGTGANASCGTDHVWRAFGTPVAQ